MDGKTIEKQENPKIKKPSSSKKSIKPSENSKELQEKITSLQEKLIEKDDKILRSYADFDNYKKRMRKQEKLLTYDLKKRYLSELIDVKELLNQSLEDEKPKEAIRLIIKQLDQLFATEHVVTIDCVGKPFDHTNHHAVTMIEKDDCEDQTIVEEIKKGYKVDDIILRPSHVIVAKKKEE